MVNVSRFSKARKNISSFFRKHRPMAFSNEKLKEVFYQNKDSWRLPASMNFESFKAKLIDEVGLIESSLLLDADNDDLPFNTDYKTIYHFPESSVIDIALSIHPRAYLSHYSAISFLNLTEQIPKNIYITIEQSKRVYKFSELTQGGIDAAFAKPQRRSSLKLWYKGSTSITILKGMYSAELGVRQGYRVTNLERTLIDAVIRPAYCGGPSEVLKAFVNSERHKASANRMLMYLKKMELIYPYHQAIGFYMERSGVFKTKQLDSFQQIPKEYRFYLNYNMSNADYDEKWMIYYPKGM